MHELIHIAPTFENAQIPIVSDLTPRQQRAQELLQERDEFLGRVADPIKDLMGEITNTYNNEAVARRTMQGGSGGNNFRDGLTRDTYQAFFQTSAGEELFALWFGDEATFASVQQSPRLPLLISLLYGWNKLVAVHKETGSFQSVFRKADAKGRALLYQGHTHVELPLLMGEIGVLQGDFDLMLGVHHDTAEVGSMIRFAEDGHMIVQPVDTNVLIGKFPQNNMGKKLAIGIPILTESEREELEVRYPDIQRQFAALSVDGVPITDIVYEYVLSTGQDTKRMVKNVVDDPLVFGGLALQIQEAVQRLTREEIPGLTPPNQRELVHSMIAVELADRISDMASLTRLTENSAYTPQFVRTRVLLYASRMMNMLEKLQASAREAGMERQFAHGFEMYQGVLEVVLGQVNSIFVERGIAQITSEDMNEFYERFSFIQQQADTLMAPWVEEKIGRIFAAVDETPELSA